MFCVVLSGRRTRSRVEYGGSLSKACLALVLSVIPIAGMFGGALLKIVFSATISALKFPPDPGMRPVHPCEPFCTGRMLYPEGMVGSLFNAEPSPAPM